MLLTNVIKLVLTNWLRKKNKMLYRKYVYQSTHSYLIDKHMSIILTDPSFLTIFFENLMILTFFIF